MPSVRFRRCNPIAIRKGERNHRGTEMDEREVAIVEHRARAGPVPEVVVLAAPSDERLVEAADGQERVATRGDTGALQILNDGHESDVVERGAPKDVTGILLGEIER